MELTVKSDTPFAKRRAKGAPLLPAAHPRRWAEKSIAFTEETLP
jgi:hypothetical protein